MIIRDAVASDASALVTLIKQLDFHVDVPGVAARLGRLTALGEPLLVAEIEGSLAGCIDWHVMTTIHRPAPVGRIVMLVVDRQLRGQGIGRELVNAAVERMKKAGCSLVEVTSNHKLVDAHRFYERLGFTETSRRFALPL